MTPSLGAFLTAFDVHTDSSNSCLSITRVGVVAFNLEAKELLTTWGNVLQHRLTKVVFDHMNRLDILVFTVNR